MLLHLTRFFVLSVFQVSGQLPAAGQFGGSRAVESPLDSGRIAGEQAALQDAVEGIGGLMQRFEQLQPQLQSLPRAELEGIAVDGQQLHTRFFELQERMRLVGGGVPSFEESNVIGFHRDLALFTARVEGKLGIMGPVPPVQAAAEGQLNNFAGSVASGHSQASTQVSSSHGREQGASATAATGRVQSATDQRLQAAMNQVVSGMQRFEALHPKLRSLPQHMFAEVAGRGQKLHEHFVVLQRRGVELSGGSENSQMREADALPYAGQLEGFASELLSLVGEAESLVQGTPPMGHGLSPAGGGLPPLGGSLSPVGGTLPPVGGGLPPVVGGLPARVGMPNGLQSGAFAQAAGGGAAFSGSGTAPFGARASVGGGMPANSGSFQVAGNVAGVGGSASQVGSGRMTTATDQRLSAVISKVAAKVQEFEAVVPQFNRLPQQLFSQMAQQAQDLHGRFIGLQKRSEMLVGDGSVPMAENDGHMLSSELESFFNDQFAFVEVARQALQSPGGNTPLGSASLPPQGANPVPFGQSGPALGSFVPSAGLGGQRLGAGGLGGASVGGQNAGRPNLGATAFGAAGFR